MEIVQIVLEQWLKYYEKFDPFVQKCFEKGINENSLKAAFIGVANQRDNLRELLIKKESILKKD